MVLDPSDKPPRRRALTRWLVLGGIACAGLLGLGLGLWSRPDFGGAGDNNAAELSAQPMPVEVNQPPPPPPAPQSVAKLEVLPPDLAAANPPPAAPYPPDLASAMTAEPANPAAGGAAAANPAQSPPAPRGSDCATAMSEADQMVCEDPDLARADREMSRAYRRALQAGASPGPLWADQHDWLAVREEAAHRSRAALASVYRQRIEELNAAANGPGDEEPGT